MNAATAAVLALADATIPGGRDTLLNDLVPMLADRKFYTAEQVAERYAVSLPTVRMWATRGKLVPSFKIPGGTARYTLEDLNEFERNSGRKEEEQA